MDKGTANNSSKQGATMNTFKTGATYTYRFICDSDSKVDVTIERRTAKSVWIKDAHNGDTVRRGIRIHNGVERIDPLGRYSMSPVLSADRLAS